MPEKTIDEVQRATMLIDLKGLVCELNHGSWISPDASAVDYLVLPLGTSKIDNEVESQELKSHVAVPICEECAKTLNEKDKEWVLVYCLGCGDNHWILRRFAKLFYPSDMVVWITACHNCDDGEHNIGMYLMDNEK